jgi:transposase
MDQPMLMPPDMGELIPEEHVVRTVNETIEQLDLKILETQYKGGGTSSYHPKMMLKVLIYGYVDGVYSSRQIAKALRENVKYMWLSGGNQPDFRTINRFRGQVMRAVMGDVFGAVVELLIEQGYVKLENYFLDGTKMEANANRHTFVWAKNTKRYKEKLQQKIQELLDEIEAFNQAEDEIYGEKDLPEMGEDAEIDSERIKQKIEELNERLRKKSQDKRLKKALKTLSEDYLPRQVKYEEQEGKFQGRNSYSKTDVDATFMRMKADQRNPKARPRAAYNVQIGTENQFVVGYSLHQISNDTTCLKPHLEGVKTMLGCLPKNMIADAGYGSEENYDYLEAEQLIAYVKYSSFHKEKTRKYKNNPFLVRNLPYEPQTNSFTCPNQRRLTFRFTATKKSHFGYPIQVDHYQCEHCGDCTLKSDCTRSKGDRILYVNWHWWQLQDQARERLHSKKGRELRSRRGVDVETVFGEIKRNRRFRRFMLRGIDKVSTEWGLLSLAHNMRKLAAC